MKSYLVPALALGLIVTSVSAEDKPDLSSQKQKVSYAIGVNLGTSFQKEELDIDQKALAQGLADALAGKPTMDQSEVQSTLMKFQQEMMAKQQAKMQIEGEKNSKDGDAYLVANAKKEGVKTTASGLQYKVLKSGNGPSPAATDTVKVNYEGSLIDGTVFDSSIKRGEPASFPVNRVIPGWTEALQLMKVGDKWQLFIPAKLAYGERSPSPSIPPNSTLIFDVELLSIEK
jgi:FKBP-type peptidyl-prolyl cis-trans isomerase FklB